MEGGMPMNIRLEMDPSKVMVTKYNPLFQKAQVFLDNEVLKHCEPYVPWLNGDLVQSGRRGTTPGSGEIRYNIVYAKYQYYGLGFHHTTDHNPQACAQWFEKAKAVHLQDWVSGAQSILKGG